MSPAATDMNEADTVNAIVIALPEQGSAAFRGCWLVADESLQSAEVADAAQLANAARKEGKEIAVIAIAPASATNLHTLPFPDMPIRQAQSAARLLATEKSLGDPTLQHVVAGLPGGEDESVPVAVVTKQLMTGWIAECSAIGLDPDYIVPAGALVAAPLGDADFVEACIARETIIKGRSSAFAADPDLRQAIVGTASIETISDAEAVKSIIAVPGSDIINLRSGEFRKRSSRALDGKLVRRMILLIALIALCSLLMTLAELAKYKIETNRLEGRTVAAASSILRGSVTAENAEDRLDERLSEIGGGDRAFSVPASGIYVALRNIPAVSVTQMSYRADGTMTLDIAAPRIEDINQALIAIQADGFKVTAVPRSGADGRAAANITVRAD